MALGDLVDPPVYDSDTVFIRRFKDPETRIRIMPAQGKKVKGTKMVEVYGTDAWPSELVHYNRQVPGGYFPCVAPYGDPCGGCTDRDVKVNKRNRQWYFNALDDTGTVRIYMIGLKLKELLEQKEARHPGGPSDQPLSQMDFIIYHIGSGLETTYDAEKQEVDPFDFPADIYIPITPVLEQKAKAAKDFYFGNDDGDYTLSDTQDAPAAVTVTKPVATTKIRPQAKEPVAVQDTTVEQNMAEYGPDGSPVPTVEQIESWDTPLIREYLDKHSVEYPPRKARPGLIELAIATAAGQKF